MLTYINVTVFNLVLPYAHSMTVVMPPGLFSV